MKRVVFPSLLLVILGASGALAMPQDGCGGECSRCHTLTVKEANSLLKGIGATVKAVRTPPVRGLWEVVFEQGGKQAVAYVDYGKKHIIPGAIYSIATGKPVSAAASPPPKAERVNVSSIPLDNSVVLGNPKGRQRLFVFTDPECPFCAKLHGELKKLTAMKPDLAVYVKLFPLKMHPQAYDKSRVILQGPGPKLLDDAFSGAKLPAPGLKTPGSGVDETIKLAKSLGITATPTLVLPDGRVMPGFRDAAAIRQLLAGKTDKKR